VRGLAPKLEEINAAVGDLRQKLAKPAGAAEMERMEGALRHLSAEIAALARQPAPDMQPVEDLSRRVEAMRKTVESQGALSPQIERMERTLAELRARIDTQPLDDLARRIDAVKGAAERSFAPHAARLDATLADIYAKLDRPAPAVEAALRDLAAKVEEANRKPALDPRLIDELARRIDAFKGVAERSFAPYAARLDAALADIRAKLDRPGPDVDSALRAFAVKLDEAAARPTTVSLDPKPIEDLARRIESVRESLERPQNLAPQVERLESAIGAVAAKLERAQPVIDAQGLNSTLAAMNARLEEAFNRPAQAEIDREPIEALAARVEAVRESVERQSGQLDGVGKPIDELGQRLETLRETVERQAERLDIGRLEDAFREALDRLERPAIGAQEFRAVVAAIQSLAGKIDGVAAASGSVRDDLMARVAERLERPGVEPDELAALAEAVADLAARIERPAASGQPAGQAGAAAEALLAQILQRLDRQASAGSSLDIEDLVHDVSSRLAGIESKLSARPADTSDEGLAQLELAVRELTERLGQGRSLEQEMRLLQDKLDELADAQAPGAGAERAAEAIAKELTQRLAGAIPGALVGHVQDIHERLDAIASARPAPAALEQAMIELTEELEAFRSAREAVTRGVGTLSEMRAEQAQLDRRMDARFSGLQEVLERIVDRLGRADAVPVAPAPRSAPVSPSRAAFADIPDRAGGEMRPAAPVLDAAPTRPRDAAEGTKAAAINAHIAAARRAANAAAADGDRREDLDSARKSAQAAGGLAQRAAQMFNQHRRPVLLGAAGLLTLATGVAVVEMRSGHAPMRKSELEAPQSPLATFGAIAPDASRTPLDTTPTGALAPAPKVIAAPLAAKAAPAMKPPADLVGALPPSLGGPLASAAGMGDVGAEVEIAQRYLEGRTVPRDPKVAAQWMQAAADAGSAFAQYRLGALYEKGVGVTRDAAHARELYTRAAQAGNARAMHNLAVLYAQDGGAGKPDYPAALEWFRKAAEYGVRDSQFNLGVLYGRGLGAPQDLAASWMWFSAAARQGDQDAARKRDEVANRMDGKAMAAAQKLLDAYKAKTPDPAVNDPPPPPAATADAPKDDKATGVKG
jgi:localization factor PodJL